METKAMKCEGIGTSLKRFRSTVHHYTRKRGRIPSMDRKARKNRVKNK